MPLLTSLFLLPELSVDNTFFTCGRAPPAASAPQVESERLLLLGSRADTPWFQFAWF